VSGDATFSGTTYQASVIAVVYVHILARVPLGWFADHADVPVAVSGETGGPGDDARIEFAPPFSAAELQAKHGLGGGAELRGVIDKIRQRSAPDRPMNVALAVNRESTKTLYTHLVEDLDRIRSGRRDGLRKDAADLLSYLGQDPAILSRLFVIAMDVDQLNHPETRAALYILRVEVLENAENAVAAWRILTADAAALCARKQRRDREALVQLLSPSFALRRPAHDDRAHRELDNCKWMLECRQASLALRKLGELEARLPPNVEPKVLYRLRQQRSSANFQLSRYAEALNSAQRALEIDGTGIHALVIAAGAALRLGDIDLARSMAIKARDAHREDPLAWAILTRFCAASGEPPVHVPAHIESTTPYRRIKVEIALNGQAWAEVITLTEGLLAEGARSAEVLFARAAALVNDETDDDQPKLQLRWREAERLATDALAEMDEWPDEYKAEALVVRSQARRKLERRAEAQADLDNAREMAPVDAETVKRAALIRAEQGQLGDAAQILETSVTERSAVLLCLRAKIRADLGEVDVARRDLDAALQLVADATDPEDARALACGVALAIGDVDLAEQILSSVAESTASSTYWRMRGEIAFRRGNLPEGVARYRDAISRSASNRNDYLSELARRLLEHDDASQAAAIFEEAGGPDLEGTALAGYAEALVRAGEWVRAQELLTHLGSLREVPPWTTEVALHLALQQEDAEAVVNHLRILVQRSPERIDLRLELSKYLIECDRRSEGAAQVDEVLGRTDLSAIDRMKSAELLFELGDVRAVDVAFAAFREGLDDARVHRSFIHIAMMTETSPPEAVAAGPDTYVRLRLRVDRGDQREQVIYSSGPIDVLRGECSVETAQAWGLLGKRVGDVYVEYAGEPWEKAWVVEAIEPAVVHAVHDAAAHYARRFPGAPFAVAQVHVGDGTGVGAYAPILRMLEARRQQVERIFAYYRQETIPLGFVVRMAGGSIEDVMDGAAIGHELFGPLIVEWPHFGAHRQSVAVAASATDLVVTRSALKTATELGLRDAVASAYRLVAPLSLRGELRRDLDQAERALNRGRSTMRTDEEGRIRALQLEPGDPTLVRERDALRELLRWIEDHVSWEPRPLVAVQNSGSGAEGVRDSLGAPSFDAVILAENGRGVLYADDLGLRRFTPGTSFVRSCSTISLLPVLAARGIIGAEIRDAHFIALVVRRYTTVLPTSDLLVTAAKDVDRYSIAQIQAVFALLGEPVVPLADAARIGANALRVFALEPVVVRSLGLVAQWCLEGMARRAPRALCAQALAATASRALLLMPQALREVQTQCNAFGGDRSR
jgi:tetratricopeptide (TPR) repeat protein